MATAENHLESDGAEERDLLGVRLGLAIVFGTGLLLGTATCVGLWLCYPPTHGRQWPLPTIGVSSAVLLIWGYLTLRRRIGPVVGDWFVLGYVLALLGMVAAVMGGDVVDFVRGQVDLLRDA